MAGRLIDISTPLRPGMVHWPDDPEPRFERLLDGARGDDCTLTAVSMSAHTGTHVDAPLHYLAGGRTVAEMPLDGLVGPARVVEIADERAVTAAELRRLRVRRGERLLLKTSVSRRAADHWAPDYPAFTGDAARWLAGRAVVAVGTDALSVDPPDRSEAHRTLLAAGIWIIEGLRLEEVRPGRYELLCLPLHLAAEGAPARAVLRRR